VTGFFSKHKVAIPALAVMYVLALIAFVTLPTAAQLASGTLSGNVVDQSGAAVPDAGVTITNLANGAVLTATTSNTGGFRFTLLAIGSYDVQIVKSSFKKLKVSGVEVDANVENNVGELKLQIGEQSATVEVTAAPPLVETQQAQVTTVFTGQQLQSFSGVAENEGLDFLALQIPGVGNSRDNNFANTNGIGFSVNGIRGRANDQQIDGQNNNDNSVTGPAIFLSNTDFVNEYEITTNNFGPEYGRNSGSVVNISTKSGTNSWHGTISGSETNSVLTTLDNIEKDFDLIKSPPRFNQEFTGGTIGGPLLKDKVFIFGGFDNQIFSSSAPFTTGNLTPTPLGITQLAGCFPGSTSVAALQSFGPFGVGGGNPTVLAGSTMTSYFDNAPANNTTDPNTGAPACGYQLGGISRTLPDGSHSWDWITRLDVHPRSADWVFIRFLFQKQIDFNVAFTNTNQAAGYPVNIPSISTTSLIDWTHTFSNRVVNEVRLSYGRSNVDFGGNTIGNTVPLASGIAGALTNVSFTSPGLMPFGPPTNSPQSRIVNTYQLQDNFDYTFGRHQLKMGGNFTLQKSPNVFFPNFNGAFTYSDWGAFAANAATSVDITQGSPSYGFKEWDSFLYVGDDWKMRDNLTLNLGLTWSYYGQPANLFHSQTLGQQTGPNPFWDPTLPISATTDPKLGSVKDLFGPSIGFAWSPKMLGWLTGNNKTVIRGGYRLTYDPAYYNTFSFLAISAPAALAQTLANPTIGLPAAPFGPAIRSQYAADLVTGVFDPRNFDRITIPSGFGPDRVHEWSLGIQRQITANSAAEVRYVGNHGWDLYQSVNANPFIAGLAASFPALVPAGVTPCTTPLATVPNAMGRVNCDEGINDSTGNTGYSNYTGLQTEYRMTNLAHQLTLRTAFTWSKTLDNTSEIFSTGAAGNSIAYSQNVLNFKGQEYGLSGLDFPHTWTLAFVEDIPYKRSQEGVIGHILGGWGFSGTYILQSGQPYTPSQEELNALTGGVANDTQFDLANIGTLETSRPFVGSLSAPAAQVGIFAGDACSFTTAFGSPSAGACGAVPAQLISFNSLNATGTIVNVTNSQVRFIANGGEADTIFATPFGNAGRNTLRDYWTNAGNFTLFKTFRFGERVNLQWHMTMNNVFNHPQYGALSPGIDPFIEDAGLAQPQTGFANPKIEESDSNNCPAGVRCIFFGLKVIF
jgi:Carboxypeptidase regulatory-like domain